jgi:hypothetical protein
MLSRVTSGRTPMLLIRLECMVRKLLKSTVGGNPSFLIVGLSCRFRRFRRLTGPPFVLVKARSPGLRFLDLSQVVLVLYSEHREPSVHPGMACSSRHQGTSVSRYAGAVTFIDEVAAEPEKSKRGSDAGDSSQRSAHKHSEHESEEKETSHASQRPLSFQQRKRTSI